MKTKQAIPFLLIAFLMSIVVNTQAQKAPGDYLHVPGPIVFDSKTFSLSWSSHPAENFYKQEYIVKGDNPDRFKIMVLTDAITGGSNIKEVVSAKLSELKRMKEANPVLNYEVINNTNTGEYMIDFLSSANDADGNMTIAERNVYRYRSFTDKAGKASVQLFGVSIRSYGPDIPKFSYRFKSNPERPGK